MDNSTKVGTITGNGSAQNISLGFVPDWVKVVNVTDGDTIDEWFAGMADGTSIRTSAAVALNATNGISAYSGGGSNPPGFTIGTAISESAKVLYYVAVRTSSGA